MECPLWVPGQRLGRWMNVTDAAFMESQSGRPSGLQVLCDPCHRGGVWGLPGVYQGRSLESGHEGSKGFGAWVHGSTTYQLCDLVLILPLQDSVSLSVKWV